MFRIFGIRLAPAAAPLALPSQNQDVTVQFWPSNMNETFEGPFSLLQMFWGSITVRPMRSSLSVIAIAIQVILVLLIVGLTSGVVSEWGKHGRGYAPDIPERLPTPSLSFPFPVPACADHPGARI